MTDGLWADDGMNALLGRAKLLLAHGADPTIRNSSCANNESR